MVRRSWLLVAFAAIMKLPVASGQEGGTGDCPSGTLFEPQRGICAQVRDMRDSFPPGPPEVGGVLVPNLAGLRAARGQFEELQDDPPVPGYYGSGTIYESGQLPTRLQATLYAEMIVHPDGIGNLSDYIMTTATNRTEKTVEVVGIYYGSGTGELGVFDWSCTPDYPCAGDPPKQGPDWIWTQPFTDLSCYYIMKDDGGGHQHNLMYYVNGSVKVACGDPPYWENWVILWNYCTDGFDLVYEHSFREHQWDCRVTDWECAVRSGCPGQGCCSFGCGGWGPIIETFITGQQPEIKELGFLSAKLRHDGEWSYMPAEETDWYCPGPPWQVFHRNPNDSWGVGNFTGN